MREPRDLRVTRQIFTNLDPFAIIFYAPRMRSTVLPILISFVVGLLLVQHAPMKAAAQSTDQNQGQIILLKNGSMLRGLVERMPNHFSIHSPTGNRLDIAFDKVEFIADSISEMYWRRLSQIRPRDVQSHESLFFWCVDQKLFEEAKNQIEIFEAIGVDANKIVSFERRMEQAMTGQKATTANSGTVSSERATAQNADPNKPQLQQLSPIAPTTRQLTPLSPGTRAAFVPRTGFDYFDDSEVLIRPLPDLVENGKQNQNKLQLLSPLTQTELAAQETPHTVGEVIQVAYQVTGMDEPSAVGETVQLRSESNSSVPTPVDELSAHELGLLIKKLPKNSLGKFRNRVEPVLIEHCSECHFSDSPSATSMQLLFRGKRQPLTNRMSERNLYSVLQHLDAGDLEQSSLLQSALNSHGGQKSASLTRDSNDYLYLLEWAAYVAAAGDLVHSAKKVDSENSTDDATFNTSNENGIDSNRPGSDQEPQRFEQPLGMSELLRNQGGTEGSNLLAQPPSTVLLPDGTATGNAKSRSQMLTPVPPTVGEIPSLNQPQPSFIPKDDFDPEIFNRRFRNRGSQ